MSVCLWQDGICDDEYEGCVECDSDKTCYCKRCTSPMCSYCFKRLHGVCSECHAGEETSFVGDER